VDDRGPRWRDLIEALGALPAREHEMVIEQLAAINAEALKPSDRADIWEALRRLVARHRSFPGADWVLPSERLARLGTLLERFEPSEPGQRYAWLFSDHPELTEGGVREWNARQQTVERARLEAARAVHAAGGREGVIDFAAKVQRPYQFGATLGQSELL